MPARPYGPIERGLIFAHRWLGIVLALLMLLWTVSGIVMLYVAFPVLTADERYSGLETLGFEDCCAETIGEQLEGSTRIVISMLAGEPVARFGSSFAAIDTLQLRDGRWQDELSADIAADIARAHLVSRGINGTVADIDAIDIDQWTVSGQFRAHEPLYKVTTDSAGGHVLYVSGQSGEVVLDTHRSERFWNWLGAVPHWIYFRALRADRQLWHYVVVWTSLFGTLMVLVGMYLGIKRSLAARGGWTRYLGAMRWHHLTGLIFGLVTLTWVFSGLLSMNPWGVLNAEGAGEERARLESEVLEAQDIDRILAGAGRVAGTDDVSMTISATLDGVFVVFQDRSAERRRLSGADFSSRPVTLAEIEARMATMRPDVMASSIERLTAEDAYYFDHKGKTRLPVYRAILGDDDETRYYFDAATGELLRKFDAGAKRNRWWFSGLHSLDFTALMRTRPLWDLLMLVLLLGTTAVCVVGCWVSIRHLRRG